MVNLKKLNQISTNSKKWFYKSKEKGENRCWQVYSKPMAVKILVGLKNKHLHKYQLAKMLGISNDKVDLILKGDCDLTLSLICRIEKVLNIKLLSK